MNDSAIPATLADVVWMIGPWAGALGDQTVEECWSEHRFGTMGTMVQLCGPDEVRMIELIVIREVEGTLVLNLRQFNPAMEEHHFDNLSLASCDADSVRFVSPGASIEGLAYVKNGDGMNVEVTIAGGMVLTAELNRPD